MVSGWRERQAAKERVVNHRAKSVGAGVIAIAVLAAGGCGGAPAAQSRSARGERPSRAIPPRPDSSKIDVADLFYIRTAGDVQLSPDAARILFTVQSNDRPGAPYTGIWIADVSRGTATPLAGGLEGSAPRWSSDGRRIAFIGPGDKGKAGIVVANADGTNRAWIAEINGTNAPLPNMGERLAWSPDGRQIAYVSSVPGPEPEMDADPIVITRYWWRPASSAGGRFNDNRRLHLFVVDVQTRQIRQLTTGSFYEHSIDWSPDGTQLAFLSNHEPDPDFKNNYDVFLLDVASGAVRQLTQTASNEYRPIWSPDGKTIALQGLKRPLTSSETNSEDTHVWTIDAASGRRREIGGAIDNRQGAPQWAPDSRAIYFTVQSRGNAGVYRLPAEGGPAEPVQPANDVGGTVSSFSVGKGGVVAFAMATPTSPAELYVTKPSGQTALTSLNRDLLGHKTIAEVAALVFKARDGREVEAFLTRPARLDAGGKHPMIVMIHGGPHGQQGPAFSHRVQTYASHGYAALMVNYRGSTGYGQAFSDAIARDQNGAEARDVLSAVDAALAKYPWIDPARLGVEGQSYGGQLTNWLVTQTDRFKAAVPAASISNLVSHNYMSVYHDYLEQEYGTKPHLAGVVEMLWDRSAIRFANRVKTPVMFVHGDNDQLVNPAEIEQFYTALKDVGVETLMVRYPREGHGMRENLHIADTIERSIAWYDRHFQSTAPRRTN
jgi:dipeptidyl aminopeptidase/acylaminoacyl peptidase